MAQIIPQETIAGSLGQGLGSGIGAGLKQLADARLQQMQQRNAFAQKMQSFQGFGLNPQEANALAALPDKISGPILLQYLQRHGGQEATPETGIGALQASQQPPTHTAR